MTKNEISVEMNRVYALRPNSSLLGEDGSEEAYREQQQEAYSEGCEELCERLCQANPADVFAVLFPWACSQQDRPDASPDFAAQLLLDVRPACPLTCEEALRAISLSQWSVSVEEVPRYLADCFGATQVYQTLDALEKKDDIQAAKASRAAWCEAHTRQHHLVPPVDAWILLVTVRYWIDHYVVQQENTTTQWMPPWLWPQCRLPRQQIHAENI